MNCLIFADNQLFNQQINNNQQASNELQSSREQQANNANDDSLASKSLATESLAKESPELILAEQPTVTTDSQAFKKGSMVAMSSTLSTTLTPHQLSNTVSTVTTSPSRGQLAAALATLLLLGGVGYYFSLPPTPPSTNNSATTSATNLALATLENGYQDEQLPTLIKKLETLVKHRETQLAQQLLPQLLRQAEANNDKPAQAKLLYLQGRIYSQTAQFNAAIAIFKQTIAMAQTLNEPQLLLGPTIGLAKIYSLTDRNALAAEHAQRSLDLARLAQHQLYQIESLQVLALSQFLASKSSDSLLPLQQSIDLARAAHSTDYLIQGYNFMGIIHTERRAFSVAEKWFKQALNLANTVVDYQQQAFLKYTTNGYYARSQALAGKINKAADLYTLALTQAYAGRVEQLLALSQLKAGLSECYRLKGSKLQAEQTLVESQMLEEQAQEKCEVNNKFLSFAVNRKISQPCD